MEDDRQYGQRNMRKKARNLKGDIEYNYCRCNRTGPISLLLMVLIVDPVIFVSG